MKAISLVILALCLAGCASWSDDNTGDMGDFMGGGIAKHIGKK